MGVSRTALLGGIALALCAPATASGHAWSTSTTLTTAGSGPLSDMSESGHAIVGWTSGGGRVALAAPGGDFAPAAELATMGAGLGDVAIAENGDAFAAWQDQNGLHVATRQSGGSWSGGQPLPGVGQYASFDLAAGPAGSATVVANGSSGLLTFRRQAGDAVFASGPSSPASLSSIVAGYVGQRVAVAGSDYDDVRALTLAADGTPSASTVVDGVTGPPNGLRLAADRGGSGAVLAWTGFGDTVHMRAARAGSDAALGPGAAVSGQLYKGMLHPHGAIARDGRVLLGWGDGEFDPVAMALAPSPAAPFGSTTAPPTPGNRTDDLQVDFDGRGAQMAGWYFSDNAANGATGRVEVATRLPGRDGWCGPETLAAHRANGYTLRLRFDAAGRGFAVWQTPAGGPSGSSSIWVSRYAARDTCPPTPPPPPGGEILREEVVYLPPEPQPVVTTVRRFVRLTLPVAANVDRRGRVRVPVRCSGEGATCPGRLALRRSGAVWANRTFAIPRGKRTLSLQLRRPARRALRRAGRAAVTAELRLEGQKVKRARLVLRRR